MVVFEHALGTFKRLDPDSGRGFGDDWVSTMSLKLGGGRYAVTVILGVHDDDEGVVLPPDDLRPPPQAVTRLAALVGGELEAAWDEVLTHATSGARLEDRWTLLSRLDGVDLCIGPRGGWSVHVWLEDKRGRAPDRQNDLPIFVDMLDV